VAFLAVAGLLACGVIFASAATNGTDGAPAALAQYTPPAKKGGGGGGGGGSALPPDLAVKVSASSSTPPAVGSELDFYLSVVTENVGGASGTRLDLTLPAGWTYKSSYSDRGSGCTGTPPTLHCDTGWINPSVHTTVTLFGTVAQPGDLTLVATITSLQEPEANPSNNSITLKLTPAGSSTQTSKPPATLPPPVRFPILAVPAFAKIGTVLRVAKAKGATYVWQICTSSCRVIPGATKSTLKLTNAFLGHSVRVVVRVGGKSKASKKVKVKVSAF
jgi:hypothetical protein